MHRARDALDAGVDPKSLRWLMNRADADLKQRLKDVVGDGGRNTFTAAEMTAYRKQYSLVLRYVQGRVKGLTHDLAREAVEKGATHTIASLAKLEKAFGGVTKPLRLEQATQMAGLVTRTSSSLLARHDASIARYGKAMTIQFETTMSRGLLAGLSQHQMINQLVSHGGPNGIFQKQRWQAERIVRTEVAHAYNSANMAAIYASRETFPDLQKKIIATFDMRTAQDSVLVHGQVQKLDDLFTDGAGRQYAYPPGRPNDRETVIPWRPTWAETGLTQQVQGKDPATLLAAPEIAQGKDPEVALEDAKAAVQGAKKQNTLQQRVSAAAKAATERINARAEAAVATQKAVVHEKADEAMAKAKRQLAHGKIAAKAKSEVKAAVAKAQQHVTAQGKAVAHKKATAEKVRAKVKAATARSGLKPSPSKEASTHTWKFQGVELLRGHADASGRLGFKTVYSGDGGRSWHPTARAAVVDAKAKK